MSTADPKQPFPWFLALDTQPCKVISVSQAECLSLQEPPPLSGSFQRPHAPWILRLSPLRDQKPQVPVFYSIKTGLHGIFQFSTCTAAAGVIRGLLLKEDAEEWELTHIKPLVWTLRKSNSQPSSGSMSKSVYLSVSCCLFYKGRMAMCPNSSRYLSSKLELYFRYWKSIAMQSFGIVLGHSKTPYFPVSLPGCPHVPGCADCYGDYWDKDWDSSLPGAPRGRSDTYTSDYPVTEWTPPSTMFWSSVEAEEWPFWYGGIEGGDIRKLSHRRQCWSWTLRRVGISTGETEGGLPGGSRIRVNVHLGFSQIMWPLTKMSCPVDQFSNSGITAVHLEKHFSLKWNNYRTQNSLRICVQILISGWSSLSCVFPPLQLHLYPVEMSRCAMRLQLTLDLQALVRYTSPCTAAKVQEAQISHSHKSRGLECLLGPSCPTPWPHSWTFLEIENSLPPNAAHSNFKMCRILSSLFYATQIHLLEYSLYI